jgi:hypothetical protein
VSRIRPCHRDGLPCRVTAAPRGADSAELGQRQPCRGQGAERGGRRVIKLLQILQSDSDLSPVRVTDLQ